MIRPPTHRVFASVAIVHDGRLLLVQEEKPDVRGQWNLPGGHVDPGEGLRAAAAREVREETGLDVEPGELLRIFTGPSWVRFVFLARTPLVGAEAGDEIMAVRAVDGAARSAMTDDELEHVGMMRSVFASIDAGVPLSELLVEGLRRAGD